MSDTQCDGGSCPLPELTPQPSVDITVTEAEAPAAAATPATQTDAKELRPIVQTSPEDLQKKNLEQLLKEFIINLAIEFKEKSEGIVVYANLVKRGDRKVMDKTLEIFKRFYDTYFQEIIMADFNMFNQKVRLVCTVKANIELDTFWNIATFETRTVIWDYINQIACLMDKRLDIQKLNQNTRDKFGYLKDPDQVMRELRGTPEGEMIESLTSEIAKINATNPMAAMAQLMQSGKLKKLQTLFTSGNVNYSRILQGAVCMLQSLSKHT
jgi:hypothetical protein